MKIFDLKPLNATWERYIQTEVENGSLRLKFLFNENAKQFLKGNELLELTSHEEEKRGKLHLIEAVICKNYFTNEYWSFARKEKHSKMHYPIESRLSSNEDIQLVCDVVFDFLENKREDLNGLEYNKEH